MRYPYTPSSSSSSLSQRKGSSQPATNNNSDTCLDSLLSPWTEPLPEKTGKGTGMENGSSPKPGVGKMSMAMLGTCSSNMSGASNHSHLSHTVTHAGNHLFGANSQLYNHLDEINHHSRFCAFKSEYAGGAASTRTTNTSGTGTETVGGELAGGEEGPGGNREHLRGDNSQSSMLVVDHRGANSRQEDSSQTGPTFSSSEVAGSSSASLMLSTSNSKGQQNGMARAASAKANIGASSSQSCRRRGTGGKSAGKRKRSSSSLGHIEQHAPKTGPIILKTKGIEKVFLDETEMPRSWSRTVGIGDLTEGSAGFIFLKNCWGEDYAKDDIVTPEPFLLASDVFQRMSLDGNSEMVKAPKLDQSSADNQWQDMYPDFANQYNDGSFSSATNSNSSSRTSSRCMNSNHNTNNKSYNEEVYEESKDSIDESRMSLSSQEDDHLDTGRKDLTFTQIEEKFEHHRERQSDECESLDGTEARSSSNRSVKPLDENRPNSKDEFFSFSDRKRPSTAADALGIEERRRLGYNNTFVLHGFDGGSGRASMGSSLDRSRSYTGVDYLDENNMYDDWYYNGNSLNEQEQDYDLGDLTHNNIISLQDYYEEKTLFSLQRDNALSVNRTKYRLKEAQKYIQRISNKEPNSKGRTDDRETDKEQDAQAKTLKEKNAPLSPSYPERLQSSTNTVVSSSNSMGEVYVGYTNSQKHVHGGNISLEVTACRWSGKDAPISVSENGRSPGVFVLGNSAGKSGIPSKRPSEGNGRVLLGEGWQKLVCSADKKDFLPSATPLYPLVEPPKESRAMLMNSSPMIAPANGKDGNYKSPRIGLSQQGISGRAKSAGCGRASVKHIQPFGENTLRKTSDQKVQSSGSTIHAANISMTPGTNPEVLETNSKSQGEKTKVEKLSSKVSRVGGKKKSKESKQLNNSTPALNSDLRNIFSIGKSGAVLKGAEDKGLYKTHSWRIEKPENSKGIFSSKSVQNVYHTSESERVDEKVSVCSPEFQAPQKQSQIQLSSCKVPQTLLANIHPKKKSAGQSSSSSSSASSTSNVSSKTNGTRWAKLTKGDKGDNRRNTSIQFLNNPSLQMSISKNESITGQGLKTLSGDSSSASGTGLLGSSRRARDSGKSRSLDKGKSAGGGKHRLIVASTSSLNNSPSLMKADPPNIRTKSSSSILGSLIRSYETQAQSKNPLAEASKATILKQSTAIPLARGEQGNA
eukprot:Nk52_evm26s271 gene=Nk52_evmTU26s271